MATDDARSWARDQAPHYPLIAEDVRGLTFGMRIDPGLTIHLRTEIGSLDDLTPHFVETASDIWPEVIPAVAVRRMLLTEFDSLAASFSGDGESLTLVLRPGGLYRDEESPGRSGS